MSYELQRILDETVTRAARAQVDAVERVCEQMLVDPRGWGVLQHQRVDLDALAAVWTVELSPLVAFGRMEVHEVHGDVCATCGRSME